MGTKAETLPASTVEIIKPAISVIQLAIIFIQALLGQASDGFISGSLFRGLEIKIEGDCGCSHFSSLPHCHPGAWVRHVRIQGSVSGEQSDDDGISLEKHGDLPVKVKEIIVMSMQRSMTCMSSDNEDGRNPCLLLCCHGALLLLQALNCCHQYLDLLCKNSELVLLVQ